MTRAGTRQGTIDFIGAFESTYQPTHDRDVAETTGHTARWREDLALLQDCGVSRLRYPIRWHRIEQDPGCFDWRDTDEVLGHMQDNGLRPIVDLLHHTSYPRWIEDLVDPRFGEAFLRYVEGFAERYPWVEEYTVLNEPFTTFLLCGQVAIWPPYFEGLEGFLRVARNVFPAVAQASRLLRERLPRARHVYVEACEGHTSDGSSPGEAMASMANDRRFLLTDLFVGRAIDPSRPFVRDVLAAGGEDLLAMEGGYIDVLGLDYYAHNQWKWSGPGQGLMSSPTPGRLADLIVEYWERYGLPCMLGETNIRGFASDRASWLKYTLEQCEMARDAGVPLDGYCWFPFIDSADWDSLLFRADGHIDPVGVFWLDGGLDRRPSSMSASYAMAAGGAPARDLPAYSFRVPVCDWLSGWMPQMSHWDWQAPPSELCSNAPPPDDRIELRIPDA